MSDCYGMAVFMNAVIPYFYLQGSWSTGSMEYYPDCTEYSGVHPLMGISATTLDNESKSYRSVYPS